MTPEAQRAEPQTLRATSLSASLTVKDLQASIAWYRDVAGFHLDEEYKDGDEVVGAAFKAGSAAVMITQDDGAKGWDREKGAGLSLYLSTQQDVDEIAKRIEKRGGTLESQPKDMPWGSRVFSLRDPDGFKWVIASQPE